MNYKNFSRAQFLKLRNGINGVREFRYDTICSQNFVSIGLLVWKLFGGEFYTDTHAHTYRSPLFFCENAERILKK